MLNIVFNSCYVFCLIFNIVVYVLDNYFWYVPLSSGYICTLKFLKAVLFSMYDFTEPRKHKRVIGYSWSTQPQPPYFSFTISQWFCINHISSQNDVQKSGILHFCRKTLIPSSRDVNIFISRVGQKITIFALAMFGLSN